MGTTNCSACFAGCPKCSTSNLGFCERCPAGQFGSSGTCSACDTNCQTCSINSTNCLTCPIGYSNINNTCYIVPANCVSLDQTTTQCASCFSGYLLSGNACNVDTTCDANSTCTTCPDGKRLNNGKCLNCPTLPGNCLTCDPNIPANCFKCSTGFYLNAGSCTVCPTGCLICSNVNYCSSAGNGYFLIPNPDGSISGKFGSCLSPCATCSGDEKTCYSCINGYSLNGTQCINNNKVTVGLVLYGSGNNPIISNSSGAANNLASGMTQINRIRLTLCLALPAS